MPSQPSLGVAWGYVGTPDQWYLPGTDISGLPEPAEGAPSNEALVAWAPHVEWDASWKHGSVFSVEARKSTMPDGRVEMIHEINPQVGWNQLKNMSIKVDGDANLTVRDVVHVDIDARGKGASAHDADTVGSSIEVLRAKRGNIQTGEDNDTVLVAPMSNGPAWKNEFRIATGDGSDTITVKTPVYTEAYDFPGSTPTTNGHVTTVRIDAGDGNDIMRLGGAREIVQGGAGTRDTVIYDQATKGVVAFLNDVGVATPKVGEGGAQGDVLIGVERLKGSSLNDVLHGNSVDNDLIGGLGDDQLIGGAGHDHFVISRGIGIDTVLDFEVGADSVEVRGKDVADIHQEVITMLDGTEGLSIWLSYEEGYDVAAIFLPGVTTQLTPNAHAGTEANWHDAVLLS
ncbi:calcium-binding protein [Arenibaculum pallidiluteum]|uniref:calcium-binding protein n=1 Tax=Arenibaculum pallidiluteum TaxID=2812559 RepID=UPI001A95D4FD|nr:calcium-binding protein [Arenibaculum pallidiluteum]